MSKEWSENNYWVLIPGSANYICAHLPAFLLYWSLILSVGEIEQILIRPKFNLKCLIQNIEWIKDFKLKELGTAFVLKLILFPFLRFFVHRLPGPFPSVSYWSQPTPPTLDPPWLVSPPHLSRVIARDRGGGGGESLSQRFKHPCLLFLISIKPSLWAIQNGSKSRNNVSQPTESLSCQFYKHQC